MANAFAALIKGLSAHLRIQLEVEDESTVHASFDGIPLILEHLPEAEQILLVAPIADMPAEGGNALCREILKGQYLFAETRGATLALDADENFVCLQIAPSMRALTPENFPALVENFLNVAETWRGRLETSRAVEAPREEATDADKTSVLMAGFRRA
ncbi:MAG: type III secretion system chaperone [Planctomycetes bacterium]|nr:type III secretion system chaperone [Planctomycetota bacterium]